MRPAPSLLKAGADRPGAITHGLLAHVERRFGPATIGGDEAIAHITESTVRKITFGHPEVDTKIMRHKIEQKVIGWFPKRTQAE